MYGMSVVFYISHSLLHSGPFVDVAILYNSFIVGISSVFALLSKIWLLCVRHSNKMSKSSKNFDMLLNKLNH